MKDFYLGNFNLESKLIQKGVLDLKAFWQFIEDKYFKYPEHNSTDTVHHIQQVLLRSSELPVADRKELKDVAASPRFMEELRQDALRTSKCFVGF